MTQTKCLECDKAITDHTEAEAKICLWSHTMRLKNFKQDLKWYGFK